MANKSNDYLIDREAQRRGDTYSGIDGFAMQDAGIQESMGSIQDRTKEHLVATDDGVIKARRKLMKAALDLQDSGVRPPGLEREHQRVRAASIVLPADAILEEKLKKSTVVIEDVAPASI